MKFLLGSGKRKDKLIDSQSSYIQIPPAPLQVNLLPLEDQQEEHELLLIFIYTTYCSAETNSTIIRIFIYLQVFKCHNIVFK